MHQNSSLQRYPPICGARAHCHVECAQRHGHLRSLLRRALHPTPKEPGGAPFPVHSPHHTVQRLVAFGVSVHVARYVAHVLQAIPRLAQEQPATLLLPRANDIARGREEGGGRRLEAKGGGVASAILGGHQGAAGSLALAFTRRGCFSQARWVALSKRASRMFCVAVRAVSWGTLIMPKCREHAAQQQRAGSDHARGGERPFRVGVGGEREGREGDVARGAALPAAA